MWQTEAVRAVRMICTGGFLQKFSTIDDVTNYRDMPVSRYFLRRYIIGGHFLIPRIPTRDELYRRLVRNPSHVLL